jgi:hypothetical protein
LQLLRSCWTVEGLRRVRGAEEEYRKGGCIAVESSGEVEKLLK